MSDLDQAHEQAKVVAHMANALATVYSDRVRMYEEIPELMADLIVIDGPRSASIMETLGNILNNMDAVDADSDAWTYPIMEEARKHWSGRD